MRSLFPTILLLVALLLAACGAERPSAPGAASAKYGPILVDALMNATYSGIYDAPITLTDGSYEGDPFVESDPARPSVEYIEGAELKGDLDDDGAEDAVVFLLERSGGSGAFTYVAAQLNRDGQPADAGAVLIEDRIGVKSAALEDGRITLEIITQGPGDAACCGMHKARRTYALQDGRLAETEAEGGGLVKLSVADLHGTNWTLLELDRDKPASAGAAVTLTFQDGQVGGSGGCNSYSASFSLGDDNPLAISVGPLIATGKSCADPAGSQESAYLAALGSVARWGYDFGRLVLYYAGGRDVESRLLFAPAGATEAVGADDSRAAAALTRNGFAIDGEQMAALDGQVIRLWRVEPKPANDVAPTEERSALPPATLAVKTATLASTHWQANPSQ